LKIELVFPVRFALNVNAILDIRRETPLYSALQKYPTNRCHQRFWFKRASQADTETAFKRHWRTEGTALVV
jgi:hypothetical protein